jgi:hypothetical protein
MSPEFSLVVGLVLGAGMGFMGGGPLWAFATIAYIKRLHRKEIQEIKEQTFAFGRVDGQSSIGVFVDFRQESGLFNRRLQYIVVLFDRKTKEVRDIVGHRQNYKLFDIPPELQEAIKTFLTVTAKNLAIAA